VQDYFAREVCLAGVSTSVVDGLFIDDPTGYGAEHPIVQTVVQLTAAEITALQIGTQKAWLKALGLMTAAGKYIAQAFRLPPPFTAEVQRDSKQCAAWMRAACAVPANESTLAYLGAGSTVDAVANMSLAAFLVSRGPYSVIQAPTPVINGGDWTDPTFRLYRLDTGVPTAPCHEVRSGVFVREWTGGRATVDCSAPVARLDFGLLPRPGL